MSRVEFIRLGDVRAGRELLTNTGRSKGAHGRSLQPLYTPVQRERRNNTAWTLVQGVLAPLQFAVFLVSLVLIVRTMLTGYGYELATVSIVVKTLILYIIMITGAIWEKVVFGQYLFARSFFWEDVFSILVLALHTAYLVALSLGTIVGDQLLVLALAAYAAYVVNALQFVLKLRAARLQGSHEAALVAPSKPSSKQTVELAA